MNYWLIIFTGIAGIYPYVQNIIEERARYKAAIKPSNIRSKKNKLILTWIFFAAFFILTIVQAICQNSDLKSVKDKAQTDSIKLDNNFKVLSLSLKTENEKLIIKSDSLKLKLDQKTDDIAQKLTKAGQTILTNLNSFSKNINEENTETRKRLGIGSNIPFLNFQSISPNRDSTFLNFLIVNSSDKYPLNNIHVNATFDFVDSKALAQAKTSNEYFNVIKSIEINETYTFSPDGGSTLLLKKVGANIDVVNLYLSIEWARGKYNMTVTLKKFEKVPIYRITQATVNGKPATKEYYHQEGLNIPYKRF